jgi:hypothetical protein
MQNWVKTNLQSFWQRLACKELRDRGDTVSLLLHTQKLQGLLWKNKLISGGYDYDESIKGIQRNGYETVMEMAEEALERIFGAAGDFDDRSVPLVLLERHHGVHQERV